jgi:hypothetical protein
VCGKASCGAISFLSENRTDKDHLPMEHDVSYLLSFCLGWITLAKKQKQFIPLFIHTIVVNLRRGKVHKNYMKIF